MIIYFCSLAEQLESIRESLDKRSISALTSFLEYKKVCFLKSLLFSAINMGSFLTVKIALDQTELKREIHVIDHS